MQKTIPAAVLLLALLPSASGDLLGDLQGAPQGLGAGLQDEGASLEEAQPQWSQEELEAVSREISKDIEELRGQSFRKPVAVSVATPADFTAYMESMEERLLPPDYADASETVTKMLALMPPDYDVEAAAKRMLDGMVGGFYDPFSGTFYLSTILKKGAERPILAHELVHALDDQYYDLMKGLQSSLGKSQDAFMAYRAVVEGSAQNLANKWTIQHFDEIDIALLTEIQNGALEGLGDAPAALWSPLVWAYTGGADFLVNQPGGGGQVKFAPTEDIDLAFKGPPLSTEQVLHPEKFWDETERDDPTAVAITLDDLPAGWRVRHEDTLGELMLALVTTHQAVRDKPVTNAMQLASPPTTNVFASGWDGDRMVLLENEDGHRVLYLATIWDTERDAGEFYAALLSLESQFTENLEAFSTQEDRRAAAGFEARYGEHPRTVLLTLQHGLSRSKLRKVTRAIEPVFGESPLAPR